MKFVDFQVACLIRSQAHNVYIISKMLSDCKIAMHTHKKILWVIGL